MTDEINKNDSEKVEYDMSFSTNGRINLILYECINHTKYNDLNGLYTNLFCLYKELNCKMSEEEKLQAENLLSESKKQIDKYVVWKAKYDYDVQECEEERKYSPPNDGSLILMNLELQLRKKAKDIGLTFKNNEDTYGEFD